jgi:hypothetical protein
VGELYFNYTGAFEGNWVFRHAKALKVTCQLLGDRLQGMLGCSEAVVFLVQGQELIALNLDRNAVEDHLKKFQWRSRSD